MLYHYSRLTRELIVSVVRKLNPYLSLWKKKKQTRSVSCKTQPCTLAANDIDILIYASADGSSQSLPLSLGQKSSLD